MRRTTISVKVNSLPLTNVLDTEKVKVKIKITRTSFKTVTPIDVWVKGPFALNSVITAIVDANEGAIKIVAANSATANFTLELNSAKNGI